MSEVLVEKLGWILLHSLWQGAVIGLLIAGALRGLQRASSNLRYILAFSALTLLMVTPVITVLCAKETFVFGLGKGQIHVGENRAMDQEARVYNSAGKFRQAARPENRVEKTIRYLNQSLPAVTSCWGIGLILVSIWHLGGYWRSRCWIRRGMFELDPYHSQRIQTLIRKMNLKQAVRVMQTCCLDVPAVIGAFKPVVLIPTSLLTGMDREALEAIVIHELVHIRRYDYLMNIVQTVIESLMFYHPVVWWLSRRIRQEREHCCDDLTVGFLGDEVLYIKSLVSLEETRDRIRWAVAANDGDLFHRIRRLACTRPRGQMMNGANPLVFSLLCLASLTVFIQPVLARGSWIDRLVINGPELPVRLDWGLAAHYPLDGTAEDISGHGNHGEIQGGVTETVDRFGRPHHALEFNGQDGLIKVAASESLNIAGSLSVSCWIKPTNKTYYQAWVSKANDQAAHSQWRIGCGQFYDFEWGFTQYTWTNRDNINYQDFWVTRCNIPEHQWTHVVAVVDQDSGQCHLYIGGRQVASFEGVSPFTISDDPLFIGFQLDNYCHFSGVIDDLRIYHRVLNPREVWALCHMDR